LSSLLSESSSASSLRLPLQVVRQFRWWWLLYSIARSAVWRWGRCVWKLCCTKEPSFKWQLGSWHVWQTSTSCSCKSSVSTIVP